MEKLYEEQVKLNKAKRAVAILEKAMTNDIVRGEASLEYVEDHLRKGKLLVKRLETKVQLLRNELNGKKYKME